MQQLFHKSSGLSKSDREAIISSFWPLTKYPIADFEVYFRYLEYALQALADYPGISSRDFATETFGDIFRLKAAIERHRTAPHSQLVSFIQNEEFPDANLNQIHRAIDLTLHFWLTLNICSINSRLPFFDSGSTVVRWEQDCSVEELIARCFPPYGRYRNDLDTKIDPNLTAVNIEREVGIRILWTSNLIDHLLYDPLHRTLCIYAHKACTMGHTERAEWLIPKQVLDETLWTLDILFPYGDAKTHGFLTEKKQPLHRIHYPSLSTPSDLQDFKIWHRRLEELIIVFNAPPVGYRQLRYDRNNPMQWWTFWLAVLITVLTIVFGMISSITALEQTRLAQKSYNLALAQVRGS